jgi:RNA polymerase sigma-70 factor (ECF subfamily)
MFVASRQQFVAMAYSIVLNTEDAEDAVQNAFVSGYLHLRNFQGRSALKTWFTRVVLNAALMIRRKRKTVQLISAREWASEEGGQWMDAIPSPQPDPEMCCARTEELGVIHEVSAQLKPRLREAFSMFYGNAMTAREARDVVGVSTGTFKARLFRARRQVISEARHALVRRPQKEGAPGGFSTSAVF